MHGIHKQIHTSHFFYKASRVPHHPRVTREVPTPIAHHNVCPLRSMTKRKRASFLGGISVVDQQYECSGSRFGIILSITLWFETNHFAAEVIVHLFFSFFIRSPLKKLV